jgi:ketosteroid isomerase-like protein
MHEGSDGQGQPEMSESEVTMTTVVWTAQNDKVVSLVYAEATVRDTGRAFVNHEAHVWTFRDGKLARFQIYFDTAAAAAAHRVE